MRQAINKVIRQNALYIIYEMLFSDGSIYIGMTQNPKRRFKDHITMIQNRNCDLHQIQEHTEMHDLVHIKVIERYKNRDMAKEREKILISRPQKSLNIQNRKVKRQRTDRDIYDYLLVLCGDYTGFNSVRSALNFKTRFKRRMDL